MAYDVHIIEAKRESFQRWAICQNEKVVNTDNVEHDVLIVPYLSGARLCNNNGGYTYDFKELEYAICP